jgi:NDP-sugar pyrophosphorylase family protein
MYPLAQLQASKYISEIIILTNRENDSKLSKLGYRTIIQDDNVVHDMFSGLYFIKKMINTNKHFVMMPCDNVSDLVVDRTIEAFIKSHVDICFNIIRIKDNQKLKQMGVFNPGTKKINYKPHKIDSEWGVITPYVVKNSLEIPVTTTDELMMNRSHCANVEHRGYWFDIGGVESWLECTQFMMTLELTHRRG